MKTLELTEEEINILTLGLGGLLSQKLFGGGMDYDEAAFDSVHEKLEELEDS